MTMIPNVAIGVLKGDTRSSDYSSYFYGISWDLVGSRAYSRLEEN